MKITQDEPKIMGIKVCVSNDQEKEQDTREYEIRVNGGPANWARLKKDSLYPIEHFVLTADGEYPGFIPPGGGYFYFTFTGMVYGIFINEVNEPSFEKFMSVNEAEAFLRGKNIFAVAIIDQDGYIFPIKVLDAEPYDHIQHTAQILEYYDNHPMLKHKPVIFRNSIQI